MERLWETDLGMMSPCRHDEVVSLRIATKAMNSSAHLLGSAKTNRNPIAPLASVSLAGVFLPLRSRNFPQQFQHEFCTYILHLQQCLPRVVIPSLHAPPCLFTDNVYRRKRKPNRKQHIEAVLLPLFVFFSSIGRLQWKISANSKRRKGNYTNLLAITFYHPEQNNIHTTFTEIVVE